ncbi:energy transducer TonB [Bacteroidales bacterium OttesenSCG-928-M11]|nr:energy transducer TonB [Bacteroidales bacterium OttesenSCG-928-M11]
MKKIDKDKIIGFGISAIVIILLLLLLSIMYLRAVPHPKENEVILFSGGVALNYGDVDWEGGTFTPEERIPVPVHTSVPEGIRNPETPSVITDDSEDAPALVAERERKEREEKEERERQEKARQEAERRRQEEIDNQMSNLFGEGNSGAGQSSGSTASGGNQGISNSGSGGYGDFDLGGRGLYPGSALPKPAYTVQDEGIVVVEVTVNPQGRVIAAQVRAKGTNITNESMRRSAIEAAKKARFAVINETNNQFGTITYRYKLN